MTAKAIVEKYLLASEAKKSELIILKTHLLNESWKEVVPLVAALSKRRSKPLIDYLISQCKKHRNTDLDELGFDEVINSPKFKYSQLLGSCIANDIQLPPDTLEEAIEWYAKGYSTEDEYAKIIFNSKFRQLFATKVNSLFFKEYDDVYTIAILELFIEIYHYDYDDEDIVNTYNKIIQHLNLPEMEEKTLALLRLMQLSFDSVQESLTFNFNSSTIFNEIIFLLQANKKQIDFVVYWATVWLTKAKILNCTTDQLSIYLNITIRKWLFEKEKKLSRFNGWAIEELINKRIKIDLVEYNNEVLKARVLEIFNAPRSDQDMITASLVGINLNIDWSREQIEQIKDLVTSKYLGDLDPNLLEYANTLGVILEEPPYLNDQVIDDK